MAVMPVQNIKLVEKVDQVAKAKWVEPGQLALAWVHSQVTHTQLSHQTA
jgi:aryl-alcohol dehydrogenase-like predicted oxidoreductase